MKIWVDDIRPAPNGYTLCKSVNDAINIILYSEWFSKTYPNSKNSIITLIDVDHDAGDEVCNGGDYIKLLDWLEETDRNYPIKIHSMNPVGIENMRRIIKRNNWKEVN